MEQLEQLKIGKRNLQVKLGKLFNNKKTYTSETGNSHKTRQEHYDTETENKMEQK